MHSSIPNSTLEKFTTFGDLLRFLRRRAGMTQLELSIAVGYSDAQISRLEQNLRLPDIPTIEARFIPVLGIEEEPRVAAHLLDLAANVRREDAPHQGLCPYKGLNYFDEMDADLFVGREALTNKLAERILALASSQDALQGRFLAIVGSSGSGKSSLVRAGVVPAIRWNPASANWPVYILTPTAHPLESLAASLTQDSVSISATAALMDDLSRDPRSMSLFIKNRILKPASAAHLLLVIDQFEELFALCRSDDERTAFINNLLTAAYTADGPEIIVITLRADFYSACAGYSHLREGLAQNQEYIGAMSLDELRRAIEEPARRGRWEFEPGLVDQLLHDVGNEPGALPLLSHALLETWQRRRGSTMTLSGYASSGGVRGAIAETAEAVFADQFSSNQQTIARRIFLRLTELGSDTANGDTRRRAAFNELILRQEDTEATRSVLKSLADARLIITSEETVEVAHEALIREWPTLRGWLDENREGLRLHHHLTEAAQEWIASNHEPDGLYRGARLAQVREWAAAHEDEMNTLECDFLRASIEFVEREAAGREAQRERELKVAQKLAEAEKERAEEQARTAGQLRQRAVYLAGAFAIALIMAFTALFFGAQARQAAMKAQDQQRVAFSRELAAAAISNLELDPERSILLALQAMSVTGSADDGWTAEAEDALRRAVLTSRVQLTLRGHTGQVLAVAFDPRCGTAAIPAQRCGARVATASDDGTAIIWDAGTGEALLTLPTRASHGVARLAFSPDGKYLITTGEVGTATIWNSETGEALTTLAGHQDWVNDVAFRPDGKKIATASEDRSAILWDAATGTKLLTLHGHTGSVRAVSFRQDGKRLATTGNDGIVNIWEADTGKRLLKFQAHSEPSIDVTFSPDGTRLVTAGVDRTAKIWDAADGKLLLTLLGHTDGVIGIAYNSDGSRLSTSGADGKVIVWDPMTGQELFALRGHTGPVAGVAFSPDCAQNEPHSIEKLCGERLASASLDGTAKLWSALPYHELFSITTPDISFSTLSPDGTRLATSYMDGSIKAWDLTTILQKSTAADFTGDAVERELFSKIAHASTVNGMSFSPDGSRLVTTSEDRTAKMWDIASGEELQTFRGHMGGVLSARFSPDGKYLATTSKDPAVILWDAATGKELIYIYLSKWSNSISFSPDGTKLAAGFNSGLAKILDVATGEELLAWQAHAGEVWNIAFHPDGKHLATASQDGTVKLWDAASGEELFLLSGHNGAVNGIAFSPDGTKLASAGQDGTVKIWSAASGQELLTLRGHEDGVADLTYSADGSMLITISFDGTVRYYLTRVDELEALARMRVTRGITEDECQQYLHLPQAQCQEEFGAANSPLTAETTPAEEEASAPSANGKVCELTDPSGIADQFNNQIAYMGVQESARKFGWEAAVREARNDADYQKQIYALAQEKCDLIVSPSSFSYTETIQAAAAANPDQKYLIFDWPVSGFEPPLDNVRIDLFAVDQAAFLAGYAAAAATKTGKVGTYGGMDLPPVTNFMDGFALGVAYYNEKNGQQVEVLGWDAEKHEGFFTGNFTSTSDGREMGDTLIAEGADIILPVAGSVGLGTVEAVMEHGNAYVIGVDSDWALTYPEYSGVILTSIKKNLDVSVISAVEAIVGGTFTGGTRQATLENGGVSISPIRNQETLIPAKDIADLEQIEADIIAGKIKTLP